MLDFLKKGAQIRFAKWIAFLTNPQLLDWVASMIKDWINWHVVDAITWRFERQGPLSNVIGAEVDTFKL
jgi:hypothetical protein